MPSLPITPAARAETLLQEREQHAAQFATWISQVCPLLQLLKTIILVNQQFWQLVE